MSAELFQQITARRQSVEEMIRLDTARRAVPDIAIQRDDDARPIQTLGDLRRRQANHAAMPAVAGDDGGMRLRLALNAALKFFDGTIEDFALRFFAFVVARVQMFSQMPRPFSRLSVEQLDDGTRRVHAARRIDSRPNAKSQVVRSPLAGFATACDFNQRAH